MAHYIYVFEIYKTGGNTILNYMYINFIATHLATDKAMVYYLLYICCNYHEWLNPSMSIEQWICLDIFYYAIG
jgi:hypothetical protein